MFQLTFGLLIFAVLGLGVLDEYITYEAVQDSIARHKKEDGQEETWILLEEI